MAVQKMDSQEQKILTDHVRKYAQSNDKEGFKTLTSTMLMFGLGHLGLFLLTEIFAVRFLFILPLFVWLWFANVRLFIVFHDCCHGSLFQTEAYNRQVGTVLGWISLSPYLYWRESHRIHHKHVGNLDKEDPAKTIFLTKQLMDSLPTWKRVILQIVRDPFVFFLVFPFIQFGFIYRFRERYNAVNLVYLFLVVFIVPLAPRFFFYFFITYAASCDLGFLLFHVQHGFNEPYYSKQDAYSQVEASLKGSSYLLVPEWLKWSTLGIEYHHIHHLSTQVPCYNLRKCHETAPKGLWSPVHELTMKEALGCLCFTMYDEKTGLYTAWEPYSTFLKMLNVS